MYLKRISLYFLFLCGLSFAAQATHLKGGEITVKRVSDKTLTFEFTLTTYTENNRANVEQNVVNFCFGDGSSILPARRSAGYPINLGNGTMKNVYKIQYTYPAASLFYKVSVAVPNRNDGVLNITRSVDVAFYVETIFSINAGLGLNSTPILLNPAVDLTAVVGQPFIHNSNAVDAEGDSLAYRLSVSRTGAELSCDPAGRGLLAPNFKQPNEVSATPSSFTMNAKTGDLIWKSPQEVGLYNCAFIIEEWRNGVKISETVRDMQIEVKDLDNRGPLLNVPADVCIQAGTRINQTITAIDQVSKTGRVDPISITSSGNVYAIDTSYAVKPPNATFVSAARQTALTAIGTFNWQTDCVHIRKEGYDVFFKAEDFPPVTNAGVSNLVDSKIWNIRVLAPAVKNVTATAGLGTSIALKWTSYTCALSNATLILYRKQGACDATVNANCATGMTASGYTELTRLPISTSSYTDNAIVKNTNYSYVVVVAFTNSKGVDDFSPMSNAACYLIASASPIMTNVSVIKTSTTAGENLVRWTRPVKLDTLQYPGPYAYQLMRAAGTGAFGAIGSPISASIRTAVNDTSYTDTGINTSAVTYRYRTDFYYTLNGVRTLLESPTPASNVRLSTQVAIASVKLAWAATVPWTNENKVHRVYRETQRGSGIFNRIADVPVTTAATFKYVDSGADTYAADGTFSISMKTDSSYCYYVETLGSYGPGLPAMELINKSQIICGIPQTDIFPCPPSLQLYSVDCASLNAKADCSFSSFTNQLTWTPTVSGVCDPDIVSYKIYYAKDPSSAYTLLASSSTLNFSHILQNSYRGCYYVTAVSALGKESTPSNKICVENCASFDLPNLFSPNGDGLNDSFKPMRCPRFVSFVSAKIVDRNGQLIYQYAGPLDGFGWNGTDSNGVQMAASSYFYTCDVVFDLFDKSAQNKSLKGWVELVR
ncbi:gliding motility-associated C-terminal domain-containing protein [Aquirufa antheringensis]|jgi:gliding motility-associated-like protein|uniref:Gliding motility-associated C-terminal domain-containing protein n=1 Tax=Aquirufa antheringensis TaxID=2516559 RepID=A0A4Q9BF18_9BACT|nr:gliding motility-associated C-terminal domain-containing protein [Aquirufa antheringensis]MCZ2484174.1 gliding motility-associated C-terminal domain-containing protein [Aquirufa antheringensis]MCZ2487959.1 gliding motility-associated C-terminal domain-containing protein [Aquirufa antheringensis]MCZ2489201.1 gliding motility-associated C-terminal domain-containing protein [Aquirufa antheringensis]TBH74614.1 gliding motility-associated C-terminal domain-containing protein [Aquirufa antheringen